MKHLRIVSLSLLAAATACATGGDWFEYPAKLSDTLEMLPGKSLGEIFQETSQMPAAAGSLDLAGAGKELANKLGKEPLPALLQTADDLIAQARAAGDTAACNLAHDIHDAVAVAAEDPAAARAYILWTIETPFADAQGQVSDSTQTGRERRAEEAKGSIKANWLYACGAHPFLGGDRTDCQQWFDRVAKEFPKHPRAEIAMFMSARCAFSQSRILSGIGSGEESGDPAAVKTARQNAVAKFEALRKRYPRGRFDADALGWLGALAFDAKDYLKALDCYIAQAETPNHPETLPSAIYNCEKTLAHLGSKPGGDAAFALIARHPRMAMAFTYLVLSAPEADNYDGKWDNPGDVRKWRRTILPRIANAVAKQKDAYKSDDWQPRYLAMLVHAASSSGNHAQALQLSQIPAAQLAHSDDLLFARGVALQRAGKTTDAIDAFQTLLQTFPRSPLTPGTKVRLALALQDNHQSGEAIAMLCQILKPPAKSETTPSPSPKPKEGDEASDDDAETDAPAKATALASPALEGRFTQEGIYPGGERDWKPSESAVYPNICGADEEEIDQLIDTLLNFAPLPELAAALDNANFDEEAKRELRGILAQRYAVAENFAEARKFLTDPHQQQLLDRLAQLTADNSGNAQEKAERMVKVGQAWAEARGVLLRVPLDTKLHLYERTFAMPNLTRRDNGQALHFAGVEDQLDDRDELRHAARWWMRAARALPGTPLAAQARLQALEALPQIARASVYAEQRAREINLEKVSREIYDKLRKENPNSPEAKRFAVYWSLPPYVKPEYESSIALPGETGDPTTVKCEEDDCSIGYPFSDDNAFQKLIPGFAAEPTEEEQKDARDIPVRIKQLRDEAGYWEPALLAREVKALDELVRKNITSVTNAAAANCLDDLMQFLSEPGVTKEMQAVYVNIRLDLLHRARFAEPDPGISVKDSDDAVEAEIAAAEKDPAFKSLQDYLQFCRIALVAGAEHDVETDIRDGKDPEHPVTYHSRDFATLEKMTREFLQKYPRSHKREAATFLLARSIYSLSCPYINCVGSLVPGTAAVDAVMDVTQKPYQQEAFKPERVIKALDDYDRQFPKGRYVPEIANLRAATWWRTKQWDKALELTMAQIADTTRCDVQGEAGTRLANIFAELANMQHRPDVLAAIKAHPAAVPYLAAYLGAATNDRAHPLRYLQAYLSDQFHFKIPPPPDNAIATNR